MKLRFPLYAKWAAGFTLHLAGLMLVIALIVLGRFREPLARWTLHHSRDRIERTVRVLIGELESLSPLEWNEPIRRFEEHYDILLALLDARGRPIAGSLGDLPSNLYDRLLADDAEAAIPSALQQNLAAAPSESSPGPAAVPVLQMRIARTGDPPRFWLVARVHIRALGDERVPFHLILAPRRWFGGLFMDPRPFIFGALAITALSLLIWTPFILGMTRTIRELTFSGRRMAEGRFDMRVRVRRRDELGELAETLNHLAAQLDAMTADQRRFLGGVAHELCAPLARLQVVLGLMEHQVREVDHSLVEKALAQARAMSDLVSELLSFSKASFGRAMPTCSPIAVQKVVEAAVREEAQGRRVRIEVPESLTVWADPPLLQRAVANLIRNAVKYAPDGEIIIRAEPKGEFVLLSVEDEGPGVPEESLTRIFEPFYRVEASRDRQTGGQGLGLTLVRAAAEAMGGTVWAELRRPRGLAVRLRLRAVVEPTVRQPAMV